MLLRMRVLFKSMPDEHNAGFILLLKSTLIWTGFFLLGWLSSGLLITKCSSKILLAAIAVSKYRAASLTDDHSTSVPYQGTILQQGC